jgi:hypothetical protein
MLRDAFPLLVPLFLADPAEAAGTVRIDWDSCPNASPVNKTIVPGQVVSLFVSVTGQSATHTGYRTVIDVVPATGAPFPDAWRFDENACQGSDFIRIGHRLTVVNALCLNFQGSASSTQQKSFVYDAQAGRAHIELVNTYTHTPLSADPGQRYFLMQVLFDHTFSVNGPGDFPATCGGLDRETCFSIASAGYYDTGDVETPWTVERGVISANDPGGACAGVTPAHATTWGAIRGRYR